MNLKIGQQKHRKSIYMFVYMYVCIYTQTHIYTHVYVCIYTQTHIYTHTQTHSYVRVPGKKKLVRRNIRRVGFMN